MILAIDTATSAISLALHNGREVIGEMTWRAPGHHTVELSPAVDGLLARAAVTPGDLHAVAVALGPGSYTGLRIGMSLAKGLALTCDPPIPLIGIPTLDILAAAQPHEADWLYPLTQAGRGRVNAALYHWNSISKYNGWEAVEPPFIATWAELAARIEQRTQICGEIDEAGRAALGELGERAMIASGAECLRRAGFLAELAHTRLTAGQVDDPAVLAPLYYH